MAGTTFPKLFEPLEMVRSPGEALALMYPFAGNGRGRRVERGGEVKREVDRVGERVSDRERERERGRQRETRVRARERNDSQVRPWGLKGV